MPPACPLAAAFVVVASGVSAWLIASRLTLPADRAPRLLAALVLWEAIEILPVHVLASLQLMGAISRISISESALFQLIVALVAGIWAVRKPRPEQGLIRKVAAQPIPRHVLAAASVLACSYVAFAANIFTSFPVGSDAVIYHLPLATRWLQEGSLALPSSGAWRFQHAGQLRDRHDDFAELGMATRRGHRELDSGGDCRGLNLSSCDVDQRRAARCRDLVRLAGFQHSNDRDTGIFCLCRSAGDGRDSGCSGVLASSLREEFGFVARRVVSFRLSLRHQHRNQGRVLPVRRLFLHFLPWACSGTAQGRIPLGAKEPGVACAGHGTAVWFLVCPGGRKTGNPVYPIQVKIGGRIIFRGFDPSQITQPDYELNSVRNKSEWLIYPWTEWKKLTGFLEGTLWRGGWAGGGLCGVRASGNRIFRS